MSRHRRPSTLNPECGAGFSGRPKFLIFDIEVMKRFIAIFFAFAASSTLAQSSFDAQKLSVEARAVISKIKDDNSVPFDTMGLRFGNLPKDYPLILLRKKLTIDELFQLTNHYNPIVRCYGFKALTQRDENAAFQVLANHLQDTIEISTHYGCLGERKFVADYFIGVFQGHEAIVHDTLHLNTLDSLLIFTPNKLEARNEAARRAGKKGKYYNRIREIAINDKLAGAVVALASFKRPEDVDIIMETKVTGEPFRYYPLATTFFAISQFPHPKFIPFLEGHLQPIMNKAPHVESWLLYQAISNYNTKEASALLARAFHIADNNLRMKHLEELSRVLKRNSNPIYNDLRKRIIEDAKK